MLEVKSVYKQFEKKISKKETLKFLDLAIYMVDIDGEPTEIEKSILEKMFRKVLETLKEKEEEKDAESEEPSEKQPQEIKAVTSTAGSTVAECAEVDASYFIDAAFVGDSLTQGLQLYDILDTPVSPELLPPVDGDIAQKTEDLVGPYALHDFFLYYAIRYGYEPERIFDLCCMAFKDDFEPAVIKKWLRTFCWRFFTQQFKRNCMPDGVKVGSVGLGPRGDWQMPSDAAGRIWIEEVDTL